MSQNKNILIVLSLIIIMAVLVLQPISAFGTDEDLKYQIQNPGTCSIAIKNAAGVVLPYSIQVSVRSSGNNIYKKFDGTPNLPPVGYSDYNNFGYNYCESYGLIYSGDLSFWDLVNSGIREGLVSYCPNGIIDPNIYDGIANLKCNSLCVPSKSVCISSITLAKCSIDGQEITHEDCVYGCDNNACRTVEKSLNVQTDQVAYSLGEDVNVIGTFSASGIGIQGITVIAQLTKTGVISELQGVTDANGNVNFTFSNPTSSGETTVKLTVPNYLGRSYEASKVIQIIGNSIQYEVATYSYTQYSSKNVTFTVNMKDANGLDITPAQLTNLHSVASLTQGLVYSGDVTYLGSGNYQVDSKVDGSGKYVGKLAFNFEGQPQSSPIIEIEVRPMGISIDASKISPGANLNDTNTYTINIFDSTGTKLDPSNIQIHVSFPDGTTARDIAFSEIKRVSTGEYEFTFNFNQVEKYTFDIYADYSNYARGNAKATVAVGSTTITGPGIPGIGTSITWIFYVGIGIFIVILFLRRRKT